MMPASPQTPLIKTTEKPFLSVVVVSHNQAGALETLLSSLIIGWADEIVVVDRGSTDGTPAVARRFTPAVYFHPSPHAELVWDYARSLATGQWLLFLDPTERLSPALQQEVRSALKNPVAKAFSLQGASGLSGQTSALRLVSGEAPFSLAVNEEARPAVSLASEITAELKTPLSFDTSENPLWAFQQAQKHARAMAYQQAERLGIHHPKAFSLARPWRYGCQAIKAFCCALLATGLHQAIITALQVYWQGIYFQYLVEDANQ